ncbi:MAG: CDP-alcohol phosphatidyltransferase family protein [Candidatus Cryptobacteroides sp.]
MEKTQSKRIQTSILNALEKKALVYLAERQPKWMTSDILTLTGTFGAIVIGLGYYLSNYDIAFLWLSSLGFLINWYGDSLDGTLARVRKQQRPIYGYYLDHTMDAVNELIMFTGAGLSPFFDLKLTLVAFVLYLMLSLNVSINAHLKSEFRLTYAKLGPTEFRIIVIIINTLLFFFWDNLCNTIVPTVVIWTIIAILALMYVVSVIMDARGYALLDPMPKPGTGAGNEDPAAPEDGNKTA